MRSPRLMTFLVRGHLHDPVSSQLRIANRSKRRPSRVVSGCTITWRVIGQTKSNGTAISSPAVEDIVRLHFEGSMIGNVALNSRQPNDLWRFRLRKERRRLFLRPWQIRSGGNQVPKPPHQSNRQTFVFVRGSPPRPVHLRLNDTLQNIMIQMSTCRYILTLCLMSLSDASYKQVRIIPKKLLSGVHFVVQYEKVFIPTRGERERA